VSLLSNGLPYYFWGPSACLPALESDLLSGRAISFASNKLDRADMIVSVTPTSKAHRSSVFTRFGPLQPSGMRYNEPLLCWNKLLAATGLAFSELLDLQCLDNMRCSPVALMPEWGQVWPPLARRWRHSCTSSKKTLGDHHRCRRGVMGDSMA
jgi:hypothetical protein